MSVKQGVAIISEEMGNAREEMGNAREEQRPVWTSLPITGMCVRTRQRSGELGEGLDRERTVEEAFQGLDYFK